MRLNAFAKKRRAFPEGKRAVALLMVLMIAGVGTILLRSVRSGKRGDART